MWKCRERWKVAVIKLLSGLPREQSDFGVYELLVKKFFVEETELIKSINSTFTSGGGSVQILYLKDN
ncbi:hypothetical protein DVA76_20100, partial [Acinetobacter baumannii]